MLKLLLGLLKGAVIGGALGYGAYYTGLDGGLHWLTYGLCGALVGLVAGRPIWALITDKNSTSWISVLKAMFGFGIGCGLYALVAKVWGGFDLTMLGETRRVQDWQFVLGGGIGAFWGAFIEIDDAIGGDDKAKAEVPKAATPKPLPPGARRPKP